jgi:hypothetical protein
VSPASFSSSACKKKLHEYRPNGPATVEAYSSKKSRQPRPSDPRAIESGVRQSLADKVSGNLVGLWLLIPEHLRLGTWDLLCGWCGQPSECVWPRLALQLVHESALCLTGLRDARALRQRGFELANGLPFLASDISIHELLSGHTIGESNTLQIALGKRRLARKHFGGRVLIIDPHRIGSFSRRQMRRHKKGKGAPGKVAQTFFCLDADTKQPVAFIAGTSSRTVTHATPELLEVAASIFDPKAVLVLADAEHFTAELVDRIHQDSRFDLLVPAPQTTNLLKRLRGIPDEKFTRRWSGYATAVQPYTLTHSRNGPFSLFVQRLGEVASDYQYKAFLSTRSGDEVQALTQEYPKRWHIEEFFNSEQSLGWNRAGTANLHIRYGHMTMSLLAQAAVYQLRQRLGQPEAGWDSSGVAQRLLGGLEGDVRVGEETIVVSYYNAPNAPALRQACENLPAKLTAEGIDPRIPWLYGLKLDFRFH